MALSFTSSRHGGASAHVALRRSPAAGICSIALLAAVFCSPASASQPSGARGQGGALGVLGKTFLAALGTAGAGEALGTLGNSLALLDARYRIENSGGGASSAGAAKPEPALSEEVVSDPSKLPPASAGSNGTTVPHASPLSGGRIFAHSRGSGDESTAILLSGVALAPPDAPEAVKNVINNANMIVGRPYVWGGGHGSFYSNGYDCSGSVSFALFGGGLIPEPLTSGALEGWGAPGPGKWITVYANAGHTFAEIAGLRWDTVGDAQGTGPRWHLVPNSSAGFVVRHPPGL
jgi:cell wall-associated NlpC family hydrolase